MFTNFRERSKGLLCLTLTMLLLVACTNEINHASTSTLDESGIVETHDFSNETENFIAEETPTTMPEEIWPDLDGNPYTTHEIIDGETYIWCDYSEVYNTLDLSQYSSWGSFGLDGIMWVEKADYAGKQIGYIDYNGNEIVPLTDTIKRACDFYNGLAIVLYEEEVWNNGMRGIINTQGEVVAKYENHAATKYNHLNNGNIVFSSDIDIEGKSYSGGNAYMFVKATGDFVEVPVPAWQSIETIDYSDGLLLIYSNYYVDPGAKYFDEEGNCVLDLDNSSEYYKEVMFASDFVDGEATVNFVGMDRDWYTVKIDKSGAWKTEPVKISSSDADTFSKSY